MDKPIFEIGASGINTEQIVRDIQDAVTKKIEQGVYADARVARAERANIVNLQDEDAFVTFYLQCLRDSVFVDIGDFEIRERRPFLAPVLIALKKAIWSFLKFYTYRLWSQQNQVNGLFVTAIEGLDDKHTAKVQKLEQRIADLEKRLKSS